MFIRDGVPYRKKRQIILANIITEPYNKTNKIRHNIIIHLKNHIILQIKSLSFQILRRRAKANPKSLISRNKT